MRDRNQPPFTNGTHLTTRSRDAEGTPSRRRRLRLALLAVPVLLTIGGAAWYFRPDPRLAAVKTMQQELFGPAGRQLAPDERRLKFQQLRDAVSQLSPQQRQGLRSEGMRRRGEEMHRFFKMAPAEKTQYLDELIAREQRRRQERTAAGQGPGWGNGPPDGAPGPNRRGPNDGLSPQDRDKRREDFLDSVPATQRNEWMEFRKELNARRQQLGLPPVGGRP